MEPNRNQTGTKQEPNWNQTGTTLEHVNKDGTKPELNWNQNGTELEPYRPNWSQSGTKLEQNWNHTFNLLKTFKYFKLFETLNLSKLLEIWPWAPAHVLKSFKIWAMPISKKKNAIVFV